MTHPVRHVRLLAPVALLPALAYGWLVAASAIYCTVADKWRFFLFPFDQWLVAAPYWRLNWWITLWVIVSAAVPTAALGLVAFAAAKMLRRRTTRPIYGTSNWAQAAEAARGGIVSTRSPFDA